MSRLDATLQDFRRLDDLARRDTALSRLDPRAKLLATLAFLVTTVSFDRYQVAALLPLAAFPLAMALLGEVPGRALLRKLAIAAPFPLLLGIFNPWLDRSPMGTLGTLEISGGWLSYASILLRALLTVSAALLLLATTGMHPLCLALQRLGLPQVFVTQLLLLHRYALLLGGEAARMSAAHRLRAGGRRPGLRVYAALLGHLLLRAVERAQRIHLAMRARGWRGELHSLQPGRWQHRDSLFLAGCSAFFLLVRSVDLPRWLGETAATLLARAAP